jgi:hypothetical protein
MTTKSIPSTILFLAGALSLPAATRLTFSDDIAPIIYANCVTCHRPGEAAPFSLISYEDVKKRATLIATVTQSRYMPPWRATHGYGEFADERRLTEGQIAAIAEWIKQGMAAGDPARLPKLPQFTDGWHLGKPDLVLEMPAGYTLPANGPDIYRNFVIPTHLDEDKWVRAIEFRPRARKAVHHVLFAYDASGASAKLDGADGQAGFAGMSAIGIAGASGNAGPLGGWAVGATPVFMPDGVALPLPKGSDVVLQMHFHLTGKPEEEQAVVGIYFAPQPPERRIMPIHIPALFGLGAGIDIPPGEKSYTIEDSVVLPVDVKAFSTGAHAHYVAKEIKATATLPDGTSQPLLWIQDWDFNWQDRYNFKQPMALPKGTRINVKLTYDNSAGNPRNPSNPPHRVMWGEESLDEMGTVILAVQTLRKEDESVLQQMLAEQRRAALGNAMRNGTLKRFQEQRRSKNVAGRERQ